MRLKPLLFIIISLVFYSNTSIADKHKNNYSLKAKLLAKNTKTPIAFAVVKIEESDIYTITDINGYFSFTNLKKTNYKLSFSCLGYISKTIELCIDKDINDLSFELYQNSYSLEEINIMAKKSKGNKLQINQNAIEYIQPVSIHDVLLLLPGSIHTNQNLLNFQNYSSRQAGSDSNTSLGAGFISDGAPITNDGMRSQMIGITENTTKSEYSGDYELQKKTGINKGVDMRNISTDHIESIEFEKGISSARYGNMSSGLIRLNSKHGISPYRIRLKTDLNNSLFYLGKGYKLSDNGASIHIGIDYLNSINDPRESTDKFERITGQSYYKNRFNINNHKLDIDIKYSYTGSINKMKKDELTYEFNESYKADYKKNNLLFKSKINFSNKNLKNLEFIHSADFTTDNIERHMRVLSTSGPMPAPTSFVEGEKEAVYLPGLYYSDFELDNKVLNVFSQINILYNIDITKKLNSNINIGIEHKNKKNYGDGAVIKDPSRPPFPYDNSYMRPRKNSDIPGISSISSYLQSNSIYRFKNSNLIKLSAGIRTTKILNISSKYRLADVIISEPRLNLFYVTNKPKFKNSFRISYGIENKLPTMNHLYPENIYKDFLILNAYSNKIENRSLITYTKIFDMTNFELDVMKNNKYEIGWDIDYKDLHFSITAFKEESKQSFEYTKNYTPINFDWYTRLKPGVDISNRKPTKDDYFKDEYTSFAMTSKISNNSTTVKKGVEYRIILPKIKSIYTKVEINGAYYYTKYGTKSLQYKHPNATLNSREYQYAGIYDDNPYYVYKRLNSNVWLNTHIPKLKLIFTNFFQFIWSDSKQFYDNRNPYPIYYYGKDEKLISVNNKIISEINNNESILRHLKSTNREIDYAKDSKPVSIIWNIKATKEFGKSTRLSFFVDNIIDINPIYNNKSKTEREWKNPYFGIELFIRL